MTHPASDDALARRNTFVLTAAQALGGANPTIVVALGGLVGQTLASDPGLATLPVSFLQVGMAAGTIPAALIMRTHGRRAGYLLGAVIGILAGCVAAFAITAGSFVLFCLGTILAGLYGSFVQSYRFAATDGASAAFRPRAIAWVMSGGLAAAIIGPQMVIWTRDLIPSASFSAAFLGQGLLALLSIGIVALLRPVPVPVETAGRGRPLGEIMRQPRFITAVGAALVSYGLMSFVMTATPMAMVECGHSVGEAALGIQWHVLAMFGPSFFTGRLIQRYGAIEITALGLVLIAAAAGIGLAGLTLAHFWVALVLLGIGWNFSFIGATTLVTECYRPEERARAQGANDFLVFGTVAIASFSSGRLLSVGGWEVVNWLVFPPVALALVFLAMRRLQDREQAV